MSNYIGRSYICLIQLYRALIIINTRAHIHTPQQSEDETHCDDGFKSKLRLFSYMLELCQLHLHSVVRLAGLGVVALIQP